MDKLPCREKRWKKENDPRQKQSDLKTVRMMRGKTMDREKRWTNSGEKRWTREKRWTNSRQQAVTTNKNMMRMMRLTEKRWTEKNDGQIESMKTMDRSRKDGDVAFNHSELAADTVPAWHGVAWHGRCL